MRRRPMRCAVGLEESSLVERSKLEKHHERPKKLQWKLLLWHGPVHGDRRALKHGVLSLQFVPPLVGRPRQRLHLVAARKREDYAGCGEHWHLCQNAAKLSQVVQNLRRSYFYRTSRTGIDGCVCRGGC